ncbi:MAG: high frequency lysogenization protein [Candidatus Azotimanducaceae bacterium]|jgi:high frequency lysogenization protein
MNSATPSTTPPTRPSKSDERALALAGIIQSANLVTAIARTGMVAQDNLNGSLESLFVTNPDSALDVYKDGSGVRTGLRLLTDIVGAYQFSEYGDTVRYSLAAIKLERALRQQAVLLGRIGAGIESIQEYKNLHSLPASDDEIIKRISKLYEETAGTIEPRIRVQGQQKHLKNSINTFRIRALLMSSIRSAVLWRQLDGRLTQFVLGRARLLRSADKVASLFN